MSRDPKDRGGASGDERKGLSRRGFLASVGSGTLSAVAAAQARAEPDQRAEVLEGAELSKIVLTVNGRQHPLLVEPRWSLAYVLRDHLGLTGTKPGCERGECGACTVLMDDVPRYACMTLAVEAEGARIVTVEGLMSGEELSAVQQAFVEQDAMQCGYCTSGQIMAAEGLLRADPEPSFEEIRTRMSGNLCRCGAYGHIFAAVQRAAALRQEQGGGAS
jgi:xanthine dehydrogenase YagT iron-sulfur-binding subunit